MLNNKTIILGVTGGIAAYKSATIVSRLKDLGADIWVVMTPEATELVGPLTFRTLSGNPVIIDLFSKELSQLPVPHISLAQKADLIVIAPCTANIIAKLTQGIADDPLTTIVLASTAKKLLVPAMNNQMWNNPAVKENVEKLKIRGFDLIGPTAGKLACEEEEIGRMSEPDEILRKILDLLIPKQDFKEKKILVTAGGTREAIDPVRYISNRSSGKMGYAIAEAARKRGAEVSLISANVNLPAPLDLKPIKVESAEEMQKAVFENFPSSDVVIMAAAVADYKLQNTNNKSQTIPKSKMKKSKNKFKLAFQPTEDILEALAKHKARPGKIVIGFALETDNLIVNAQKKMHAKDLDLIVANGPKSFQSDEAEVVLITKTGKLKKLPILPKKSVANRILDEILEF